MHLNLKNSHGKESINTSTKIIFLNGVKLLQALNDN